MLDQRWLATAQGAALASMDAQALAQIVGQPGFHSLLRPWVATWRVGGADSAMLARTLRDVGRFLTGIWALELHATPGGLTLSRLSEKLERSGLSGPGRARSILIFLRFIGYIEPTRTDSDGRVRRFAPTDRMLDAFRQRVRRDLNVFWPVDPAILALGGVLDDDGVLSSYMAGIGEVTAVAFGAYKPDGPTLEAISQRFGGMAVLAELLLSVPESVDFPPTGELAVTVAGLARTCHISRAQVRAILVAAEREGYLAALPDARYRLTALLTEHLALLLAGSLIVIAYSARRALATTGGQQALDPEPHFV